MDKFSLLFLGLATAFSASAASDVVSSPDGRLSVEVTDAAGTPKYSVKYDGVDFLMPSPLGFVSDLGDYTSGMTMTEVTPVTEIHESYSLPNIKKSNVDYNANQRTFKFTRDGKPVYDVIFQVADNDVAFKYHIYPQRDRRSSVIKSEATGFVMPDGTDRKSTRLNSSH